MLLQEQITKANHHTELLAVHSAEALKVRLFDACLKDLAISRGTLSVRNERFSIEIDGQSVAILQLQLVKTFIIMALTETRLRRTCAKCLLQTMQTITSAHAKIVLLLVQICILITTVLC